MIKKIVVSMVTVLVASAIITLVDSLVVWLLWDYMRALVCILPKNPGYVSIVGGLYGFSVITHAFFNKITYKEE